MRKKELFAVMKKAARAVKENSLYPNSGMMLIKLKDGRLSIATRNRIEHILVTTEADGKELNCIVNAVTFLKVINKFPAEEVSINMTDGDFFTLINEAETYMNAWENYIAHAFVKAHEDAIIEYERKRSNGKGQA